jgi:SAM-dependent methyltransferase
MPEEVEGGVDADADAGRARQIFVEVHTDLPRQGPGNRVSTARAVEMLGTLPADLRILDVGCGPGMQTADLADLLPDAVITAVDAYPPFVEAAEERMREARFDDRVTVAVADMRAMPYSEGAFDLIWCEGAAYIMGVTSALTAWRPLLAAGGRVAFTDAVWLTDDPPAELRNWWQAGYPEMGSVEDRLESVARCGYRVLDHFVLPEAAWWDHYYGPMEDQLADLRVRHGEDPAALAALEDHQREIDYYRRWPQHYGYLFVVSAEDGPAAAGAPAPAGGVDAVEGSAG